MKIVVVAHISRQERALALAAQLGAHLLMDTQGHGADWNHRRALAWATEQDERVVVLEDDAEPVEGFTRRAQAWCRHCPDDLLSFYLGTGRPPQWQDAIRQRLDWADQAGTDRIALPELLHGVAYSLPTSEIVRVLNTLPARTPIDYAIGRAWRRLSGREVIYPAHSLVDHADGPSIEKHPDGQSRTETRRAWRLAA